MKSVLPALLYMPFILLLSVSGCSPEEAGEKATATAVQDSTDILFTISGLDGPEAVRYNPSEKVYYISNFTGGGSDRDANGYITKASETGEILELKFMSQNSGEYPLHAPRGMYLNDQGLWAADVDGVHLFDTETGEQKNFYSFSEFETGFLNDITGNSSGDIFISDTGTNTVFSIRNGKVDMYRDSLEVSPNGIFYHAADTSLYLAPWRGENRFFRLNAGGETINTTELPGGFFDGAEFFQNQWILSSQLDSAIIFFNPETDTSGIMIRTPGRGADIGINTDKQHIAVPYIAKDRVDIWQIQK